MSPPPVPSFTPKQGQYLAFIYAYTRVLGRLSAEADLQRHFGVSPPSVHQMVLTLERAGLIRRQPGVARSIEVLVAPELLPVLRDPGSARRLYPGAGHHMQSIRAIPVEAATNRDPGVSLS